MIHGRARVAVVAALTPEACGGNGSAVTTTGRTPTVTAGTGNRWLAADGTRVRPLDQARQQATVSAGRRRTSPWRGFAPVTAR